MKRQSLLTTILLTTFISVIYSCQKDDKLSSFHQLTTPDEQITGDRGEVPSDLFEFISEEIQPESCCSAVFDNFEGFQAYFKVVLPENPGYQRVTVERVRPTFDESNFVHYVVSPLNKPCRSGRLRVNIDKIIKSAFRDCPDRYRILVNYAQRPPLNPDQICAKALTPIFNAGNNCILPP